MSNKYVVKKLKEYADIHKSILGIKIKINIINDKITKVRTSKFNDYKGSGEYILEKLIDDKKELEIMLMDKYILKENLDKILDTLDKNERDLLKDIYCKNYSIKSISLNKKYSASYIYRMKDKAIEKLSKLIV